MQPERSTVTTADGVDLAVHDWGGPPDAPTVLLAHATGFHGLVWSPLADRLVDHFRCVALDFRAHGDSRIPPDQALDWHGFGVDVLAVVDALELQHPLGVGHSKGGAALLLAESSRPGTFAGLLCWEPIVFPFDPPVGPLPDDRLPLIGGALARRPVFESRGAAYDSYAAKPPLSALHPDALLAYVEHGFADEPDGTVSLKCRPADEAQTYRMGAAHDAFRRLPDVTCPVVVACGEQTDAVGPDHARALADRLPHGRVRVVPGLGHFGPLEDPTRVAAAVVEELGG